MCIRTYLYIYIYVCMYVCMYVRVHKTIYIYVYMHILRVCLFSTTTRLVNNPPARGPGQ